MKTLAWIIANLIFIISDTVQADDDGDMETRRHHEDDVINEKMERYEELLKRKRDVIDKFLKDNYSDFNHSDYTPEVMTFISDLSVIIIHSISGSVRSSKSGDFYLSISLISCLEYSIFWLKSSS